MQPSRTAWTPGRSLGRGCLVQLAATVFVLGWVGCAGLLAVALPVDGDARIMIVALSLGALLPVILIGGVAFGLWNRRRIATHTDDAVGSLGLEGQPLMTLGRHYHGQRDGRAVRAQMNRGPRFDLWVQTPTATRAAFLEPSGLQRSFVTKAGGRQELELPGSAVRAFTDDPDWVGRLIADVPVRAALARLAAQEDPPLAWQRQLHITPAGLRLLLHRVGIGAVTDDRVAAWYDDMVIVADAIEGLGPSPAGKTESRLETSAREAPAALAGKVGLVVVGCAVAAGFGVVLLAVLVMLVAAA